MFYETKKETHETLKDMKKNLWIWALAALSMTACTSEDVATTPEVTENDWISPDGQVLIQLSADGLPTPSASVGRAAIESEDIKQLDRLGIFALSRGGNNKVNGVDYANINTDEVDNALPSKHPDLTPDNDYEILLDNVFAKGADVTTLDEDLHDNLKRIRLYQDEEDENASIYYYPIQPNDNYNFYGYFPYQSDSTKVKYTKTKVYVEFEPTNGDADIITGCQATVAPTMAEKTLYVDENDQTKKNASAFEGYNSRYIRNIKYHNWLIQDKGFAGTKQKFVPAIQFKHRTAFLEFFIIANDKQAGATPDPDEKDEDEPYIDIEKTKQLRVKDLFLVNENRVATWNVTDNNITWSSPENMNMIKLELDDLNIPRRLADYRKKDISEITADDFLTNEEYLAIWKEGKMVPAANKDEARAAGYLLVQPKRQYQVSLTIVAPVDAGNAVPEEQTTTLNVTLPNDPEGKGFQEGVRYRIYIQLNALQEVNIHAELADWEQGDDVFIPVGE